MRYTGQGTTILLITILVLCFVVPANGATLSGTDTSAPSPVAATDAELNDSLANATSVNEGRYDGEITVGDEDYYAIDLNAGDTISVSVKFSNSVGNLDLEVARNTVKDGELDPYTGSGDAQYQESETDSDNEQISLSAEADGTYYIHIDGRDDDTTSAPYTLVVDRKTPSENDPSEPTYSLDSAANITEGRYDRTITKGDEDYYAIDLNAGDTLSVAAKFSNSAGNLDMEIARNTVKDGELDPYTGSGDAQYQESETDSDNEQISLSAEADGTYYIHVDGRNDDTTSAPYTLVVDRKTPSENDPSEPTYSLDSAANITEGRYDRTITKGDEDYYAIDLNAGDTLSVAAKFSNSAGNLDMEIARNTVKDGELDPYTGSGDAQYQESETDSDNEQISLTARADGTYYIHIDGRNDDTTSATYTLVVDRKTPSENDPSEPTYSPDTAAPIEEGRYDRFLTTGDEDYYVVDLVEGDKLSVTAEFSNSVGNLDMAVARNTVKDGELDPYTGSGDAQYQESETDSDNEQISLTADRTGLYYIHIDGRDDDTTSVGYTLDVNTTESVARVDAETETKRFENGSVLLTTTVTNQGSTASDRVTLNVDSVASQWRVEKHTATSGLWSADISWEFDSISAGGTETTTLLLSPRTETRSPPRFGTVVVRNTSTRLDAETAVLWADGSSGDTGETTSGLTITATDERGEPTANVAVKLITEDWSSVVGRSTTGADGKATFTGLTPARYNFELTGPNGSYWGPGIAEVGTNGAEVTVQRPEPYHVKTVLTDRTDGDGVYRIGERINVAPLVKNNGSYTNNRSTRVRIAVDTDNDSAADVMRTRGGQNVTAIPEGETQWYGYDFVPSTTGTKAVNVTTQAYINGEWVTTDATGWATEFTVNAAGDAPAAEFQVSLPPERDGGDLVFTGRLVNPSTGEGLAGKTVSLMDKDNLLADDPNFADNELASTTTNATGYFTIRWTASQLDGLNPDNYVQTYIEYEGGDATADLRYPADEPYLIQVAPSVAALDYDVWTATPTVVEQQGSNTTVELLVGETGGFTPIEALPQDYYAMPNIDVRVEGLPSDTYTITPQSHELLTVIPLPYQTYPEPTFRANLTVDTNELAPGTHEVTVVSQTESGTMVRRQNVTIDVVKDTTEGQRAVVYNTAERTITPRWWSDQARNKALSVAIRDPVAYTIDKASGIAKSFTSGPGSMIKETATLLADIYENRLDPTLEANSRATVGEYLQNGAADSGTNITAVKTNMSAIPSHIERGENATAERKINATLKSVRAWKAAVKTTGSGTSERTTAVAALNSTETVLERDAAMLAGSGSDTEEPTPDAPSVVADTPARDTDNDGAFEDVNGDGEFDIVDVSAIFQNRDSSSVQNNPRSFDFNGDGEFNIVDVSRLFQDSQT